MAERTMPLKLDRWDGNAGRRRATASVAAAIVGLVLALWSALLWGCVQVPVDARAMINSGYAAALRGDEATTRRNYEKALAAEPGAKGHRVSYGWALFNLKQFEEAYRQWSQAHAGVDRDAANIEVCLALACYQTGRRAEALDWYAKQVARDDRFGDLAGIKFATGHWRPLEQETLRAVFEEFSRRPDRARN